MMCGADLQWHSFPFSVWDVNDILFCFIERGEYNGGKHESKDTG